MKERPILFSAPMVRALLDGSKTQTRRVMKVQPPPGTFQVSTYHHPDPRPHFFAWQELPHDAAMIADDWAYPCPYGQPGDRLWVRETFLVADSRASNLPPWVYAADYTDADRPRTIWKPSIHMPRAASRITLEITAVRLERLQAISRGDAMAEGCPFPNMAQGDDPRKWYAALWGAIHGPESWSANPWVWVVEFKVVQP